MKAIEIKPNIYWVGGIDWNLRDFHGYQTPRGSSYNAYLIKDKHITLIDTVKHYLVDEMMERIQSVIDPKKIDYIISNHVEMDHSGGLPKILRTVPNAKVITSTRGEHGLKKHYKTPMDLQIVESGETLSIGKRTLSFVHIPMVHWPDSMVTYSSSDRILFPNDAFGQHIASTERFDDEIDWGILREEAAKYYSNIVFPYGGQVSKALTVIKDLDIDMIAPSHGIIWRSHIQEIAKEYKKWANNESEPKAVILYDTMWGSTETIAKELFKGLQQENIPTYLANIRHTHNSDIITKILDAKLVLIGSPTLNNGMMPTIGGFLTYLKGLRPKNRIGFVFGSYGWGGQAVGQIEEILKALSWELPLESLNINFRPTEDDLRNLNNKGQQLAKYLKENM
jgi:flavorubredoxin